ncbi:Atlastin-3, partial [Cichlidogyrus casuarinus]
SFVLDEKALESILLRNDIKNKKVCVISIAGAFRKGKSFLLDFFLRYLNTIDKSTWLKDPEVPLKGFPWRAGSERETTGILMWSEPFLVTASNGEEIALILMDTQGSFDTRTTVKQCATIFALSTMLSSVQIYNIQNNLQEDNLQHLQLFTEYGRLASESGFDSKPFENLLFLIRDWCYKHEYDYGFEGGQKLLDKRLDIDDDDTHSELKNLRIHLKSCFSRLYCFLLPHPGMEVASDPNFDGKLKDINPPFVDQLGSLVPSLLDSSNLRAKQINGVELTAKSLFEYFKVYMRIYQGDTLPEPKSMLEATAEANNISLVQSCRDHYLEAMNKICGPGRPYVNTPDVENAHLKYKLEALTQFEKKPKMGSKEYCRQHMTKLTEAIDSLGDDFHKSNADKNVLKNMKTPACLILVMIVAYVLTGITELVGLSPITRLLLMPFYLCLLSLITWLILSYAGQAPGVIEVINQATDQFFNLVMVPTVQYLAQLQMRHLRN